MDHFQQQVFQVWADFFRVPFSQTQHEGTSLIPTSDYPDAKFFQFWYIGQHHFVELDPQFLPPIAALQVPRLSAEQVLPHLPPCELEQRRYFFLRPQDFRPYLAGGGFKTRVLNLADQADYDALMATCTEAEVAEVDMSLMDEVAFGCYKGDELVAAASMSDFRGFCDVGVITHPDYRGLGLGKAVTSLICEWVLAQNRIMLYIVNVNFKESTQLAQSLGFEWYIFNENLRPKDKG